MFNGETDDLAAKPYIPQKKYFNESVANALRGNIGIVNILTSEVMEAVRGQKHLSEAKKGMEELIYWKFLRNLKKPLVGAIRVKSYDFWGHRPPHLEF